MPTDCPERCRSSVVGASRSSYCFFKFLVGLFATSLLLVWSCTPGSAQSGRDTITASLRPLTVKIRSKQHGFGLIVDVNRERIIVVTAKHLLPNHGASEPIATAQLYGFPDEPIPLFRLPNPPAKTKGDFEFLSGRRPKSPLPIACYQDATQTHPNSTAWLIASPRFIDDPWTADGATGHVMYPPGAPILTLEGLNHVLIEGASGGPVVGDAGVFGITSEVGLGVGFAVPIWDVISAGSPLGIEFNRLKSCTQPPPPRESAYECLGTRDPTCFTNLSLQLAAFTRRNEAFRHVSLVSARLHNPVIAMHAAKSIGARQERAVQYAVLSRIFANNDHSTRAELFRAEIDVFDETLRVSSLMTIAKYTLPKRRNGAPTPKLVTASGLPLFPSLARRVCGCTVNSP